MVFDTSVALTWILFIAMFPISFIWLRRAWRIFVNKDYSEVAISRGITPPNAARYAPFTGALNFVAGLIMVYTIGSIIIGGMAYETWSAMAGSTIWMKIILDFVIGRQARLSAEFASKAKAKEQAKAQTSAQAQT
ncbi:hypothetical protein [Orrella marina]|uniref:hypothetical protein n=1 Tax=Orrella marina TaxID=2163011 RepID=UPI001D131699|nr:hypothetical protein [Orrella marina]